MSRKPGLGKGLDALIPVEREEPIGEMVRQIPVITISPNPRQPRQDMNAEELSELAASIREYGILQPLIVTPSGASDEYILIAGERRLRASKLLGMAEVPAIVRSVSEIQRLELALIENIQRSDLSPLETAQAYQQLIDEFQLTHEEVSDKVGKSRTAVTNTIRLLKLPEKVQQALREGRISEGHARTLLALSTSQAQVAALQTVLDKDLNVRQTEQLVKKLTGQKETIARKPVYYAQVKGIEQDLQERLGTKVTLHYTPKGGTLIIHYYSDEELDSILSKIGQNK